MNQNLAQIAKVLKGQDPQQVVMKMVTQNSNIDPLIAQLITFIQKGDEASFMELANTAFSRRGLNLNDELNSFLELMM